MCPIEPRPSGLKLQRALESSGDASEDVVLHCPECAARLKLLGYVRTQSETTSSAEPITTAAALPTTPRDERSNRATLTDWLPASVASPLVALEPVATTDPSAVDEEADTAIGAPSLDALAMSEASVPVAVGATAVDLLENEIATRPYSEIVTSPNNERIENSVGSSDASSGEVAVLVDERGFAEETSPASRRVRTASPMSRDVVTEGQSMPGSRSLMKRFGFGVIGVLALAGFALVLVQRSHRTTPPDASRRLVVAAASPVLPATASPALPVALPVQTAALEPTAGTASVTATQAIARVGQSARSANGVRAVTAHDKRATVAVAGAQESSPEQPSEVELGPFDVDAAASALDGAAARASACRKSSDPSGLAVVTVTFAPSGRVTTATIAGPPFLGTATGGCIAAAMRTAKIPAFSGSLKTVRRTVTIR